MGKHYETDSQRQYRVFAELSYASKNEYLSQKMEFLIISVLQERMKYL